jgi:DNA-binding Lrp family transcriptional regulator
MGKQQEIIDQHFLPQCYLNGFVNEKDVLYTLDLKLFAERGKIPYARESNPAKICKDEHFYTVNENAKVYNLGGVTVKPHTEENLSAFLDEVVKLDEVMERSHLAGKFDFLLKIAVGDMDEYNELLRHKLAKLPKVDNMESLFVMSQVKNETAFKL